MSGAPIMDCKKALEAEETLEGAFEWLREHGLSKITAKAKLANEGLLGLWQTPSSALLLEVRFTSLLHSFCMYMKVYISFRGFIFMLHLLL